MKMQMIKRWKWNIWQLTEYLKLVHGEHEGIYHILKEYKIEDAFSNVEIRIRIFLSIMVTNCSVERFFSKLKIIKN